MQNVRIDRKKHGKIIIALFVIESTDKTERKQFKQMKHETSLHKNPVKSFFIPRIDAMNDIQFSKLDEFS